MTRAANARRAVQLILPVSGAGGFRVPAAAQKNGCCGPATANGERAQPDIFQPGTASSLAADRRSCQLAGRPAGSPPDAHPASRPAEYPRICPAGPRARAPDARPASRLASCQIASRRQRALLPEVTGPFPRAAPQRLRPARGPGRAVRTVMDLGHAPHDIVSDSFRIRSPAVATASPLPEPMWVSQGRPERPWSARCCEATATSGPGRRRPSWSAPGRGRRAALGSPVRLGSS